MIQVSSKQAEQSRINTESMVSFDGVNQYASAGVNQNINVATDYTNSFAIGFFVFVNTLDDHFIAGAYVDNAGLSVSLRYRNGVLRPRIFMRRLGQNANKDQEGDISLKVGQLYYIVVNYNSTTQIPDFYVNGVSLNRIVAADITINGTLFSSSHDFRIGMNRNMNNNSYANAAVSHLSVFNRTLTPEEIQYIHAQGGLLPASVHAACVAHYPCTHREGNTLFDVVEQYNYAKATVLVPYHATLQNFTAAQHTGSGQTAWKEFYNKKNSLPYFTRFNGTNNYVSFGFSNAVKNLINMTQLMGDGFTVEIRCRIRNFSKSSILFSDREFNNPNQRGYSTAWSSNSQAFISSLVDYNTGAVIKRSGIILSPENPDANEFFHYIVAFTTNDAGVWRYAADFNFVLSLWDNSLSSTDNITSPERLTSGIFDRSTIPSSIFNYARADMDFVRVYDRALTQSECDEAIEKKTIPSGTSANLVFNTSFEVDNNSLVEQFNTANTVYGNRMIRTDKASGLPPLRKALRFDGTDQYAEFTNFPYTSSEGITIVVSANLNTDRNFRASFRDMLFTLYHGNGTNQNFIAILGDQNSKQWRVHINSQGTPQILDTPAIDNTGNISQLVFTLLPNGKANLYWNGKLWDTMIYTLPVFTSNPVVYVGAQDLTANTPPVRRWQGNIMYAGIAKGIATPRQVTEMWNNGLLAQPRKEWTNLDWQLLLNFNHIIDNAGTYELENLGSAGGNAVLSGYTADDVALARREISELQGGDKLRNGLCFRLNRADGEYLDYNLYFASSQHPNHFTFWFFPLAAEEQMLLNNGVPYSVQRWVRINADGTLTFNSTQVTTTTQKVNFGAWNFIGIRSTIGDTSNEFYLNGQLVNITNAMDARFYHRIGHPLGAIQGFNGYIFKPASLPTNANQNVEWNAVVRAYRGEIEYGTAPTEFPSTFTTGLTALNNNWHYHTAKVSPTREQIIFRKSGNLVSKE